MTVVTRGEIVEALRDAVEEVLGSRPDELVESTRLSDDLGIDSMDMIEVLMVIEERFGIRADPESFADVEDVSGAIDVIIPKIGHDTAADS